MPKQTSRQAQAGFFRNLSLLIGAALIITVLSVALNVRAAEVIVDDGDAEYADTGWSLATDQGYPLDPGMDVHYIAAGDGSQTATWTPNVPSTESYQVLVSWTTHSNRATNAPYTVNHAGGSNAFTVNQEQLADQVTAGGLGEWSGWYALGTFTFNAGTSGTVVLTNAADEYVIADAVRLVSVIPSSSDVSGMKWKDTNGDGIKDANEPGLPGWTIVAAESFDTLSVDSSAAIPTATDPLTNGEQYLVRVEGTYDAGDTITADAKYSVRAPNTYWTDAVQNYTSYGTELLDLQIDGASPAWGAYNAAHRYWLPVTGTGASLSLLANDIAPGNNVGSFDVTIYHVTQATTTKEDGSYLLEDVLSPNFIVAEVPQAGWVQSAPAAGSYAVTSADTYTGYNFGNQPAPQISGQKFDDLNGNSIKDPGEPGIPGWTVSLLDLTTNIVTPLDTDANGNYEYANLPPGSYRVSEIQETGWTQTFPQSPSNYTIPLTQGMHASSTDFGNFKHFSVSGIKYEDIDGSGSYDAGEPLLQNWEIQLTSYNPTTTISAFTDINGAYSFGDLGPGVYKLNEVNPDPSVWAQSEPAGGGVYVIEGESGAAFDVNFGNYRHVAISGKKYQDNNFNGVRNAGDPFLGGWTIELISLRDGTKQTVVTKQNNPNKGSYAFTNLRPGRYIVREILQKGWLPVSPRSTFHTITTMSGDAINNLDFGNNTIKNYAVWRILNPNAPFVQAQSSEMALPNNLPTPDQSSANAGGQTMPSIPVQTNPLPTPPVSPVQGQPSLPSFISNLLSRVTRNW